MKKLRGFTLLELLVGMIISSIVISAGYLSYDIVLKQFINYKTLNNRISQALMTEVIIQHDFSAAISINKKSDVSFSCRTEKDSVLYTFYENYILRTKGEMVKDTFFVNAYDLQPMFFHKMQDTQEGLIDEFSFKTEISGETETLHLTKWYDAKVLMEHEMQTKPIE